MVDLFRPFFGKVALIPTTISYEGQKLMSPHFGHPSSSLFDSFVDKYGIQIAKVPEYTVTLKYFLCVPIPFMFNANDAKHFQGSA